MKIQKNILRKKEKLILTGNPVRENLTTISKEEAIKEFRFDPVKENVIDIRWKFRCRSINKAVSNSIEKLEENGYSNYLADREKLL